SADFTSFLHPDYGVCYTFSGGRSITRPGKLEGLRMMMIVNQNSPSSNAFDFLPTTESATIWAVIYSSGDIPDFHKDGFRVGVSTQAFVALSLVEQVRLAHPFGNCSSDGSSVSDYYGNYTYTLHKCLHSCLQRLSSERCNCVDPLFPKTANQTFCTTPAHMQCLMSLTDDVSHANTKEGKKICGCQPACNDFVYKKIVTNSIFPSENYKVATGTQAQRDALLGEQRGGRTGGGRDDDEDYNVPPSSTTAARSPVTISNGGTVPTGVTPTTTGYKNGECKYKGPPDAARTELATVSQCRNHYKELFNDPNLIVIQGFPCTSSKLCKACVMFANPPTIDSFPCSYSQYPTNYCDDKNNK
ncbi:hypothetical protein PFISCL1PPCAC_14543, partial [Pristionchus fissidentatus]